MVLMNPTSGTPAGKVSVHQTDRGIKIWGLLKALPQVNLSQRSPPRSGE